MAKGFARSFDQIVCGDFETYYDDELSLRKMSMAEYIRDDRFHVTALGLMRPNEASARVYHERDVVKALDAIDWSRTAFLGHHTQFDAMILTYFYGIKPCFYLDTLSMARALHGTHGRLDLDALAKLYGRGGKVHKAGLVNMKGVHDLDTLPPAQKIEFINYTGDDVEDTMHIGAKQLLQFPPEELQLIDMTVRMFVEPMIEIDAELAAKIQQDEIKRKADLLVAAGVTDPKQLSSNDKFAALLEGIGVTVPTKISKKTGREAPALALGDIAFKALLEDDDPMVVALVEARIATKSTLMETRSAALVRRAKQDVGNFPVYLKYAGAHTLRWSGGDRVNPQNLTRGSDLRKALVAPDGYMFNICDSAQIEARMNAWRSHQTDIVEAFRAGTDVYKYVASRSIFGKDIELITKDERFIGKVVTLALGYGMGAPKFKHTLKVGQFGPSIDMDLESCYNIVNAWRVSNRYIVQSWRDTESILKSAFLSSGGEASDGLLIYERFKTDGYIHLPNGLYMRYHNVDCDEQGNLIYETRMGKQKLYGGLLCIAEGTGVLSNRGWIRIEEVRADDLIHDGIEFVPHGGLLYKGVQECVIVDGVEMTGGHEVLTDEGWKTALEKPEPYRPHIRGLDRRWPGWIEWKKDALGVPVSVRKPSDQGWSRSNQVSKARPNSELRLLDQSRAIEAQNSRHEPSSCVCSTSLNARALSTAYASSVGKLRRAWNQGVRAMEKLCAFLGGHGGAIQARLNTGSEEQQQGILAGKLPLGILKSTSSKQAQQLAAGYSRTIEAPRYTKVDVVLPAVARARPVYDILDCGPRQRFVVAGYEGPFVVHNCENIIQCLSRIIIGEQMLAAQAELPMRIVTCTHDEIVGLSKIKDAERNQEKLTKIMCAPPAWAQGVPLGAAGGVAKVYHKPD